MIEITVEQSAAKVSDNIEQVLNINSILLEQIYKACVMQGTANIVSNDNPNLVTFYNDLKTFLETHKSGFTGDSLP